ncbi:MAG TPA: phosphate propanoyltransferase [Firmicutes bacterium]|nr:phosphate propanoyltransferase [Bacillota bacterium]
MKEGETIPVGVSARHIHVTQEDLETLFGPGYKLTKRNDLSQPGQYAANECVAFVGPKGKFDNVRILGPVRSKTQIELSATDARKLGVDPPVRDSGDVAGSPGLTVIGPKGKLDLKEGVILAKRHIHATPEDAARVGLKDKDIVAVKVLKGNRKMIMGDVLVRVRPDFKWEMHVDTDEANAAGLAQGDVVEICEWKP